MREYGIDLVTELPRLTLRRFMVLVRGLGPHSAVANRAGGAPRPGRRRPARMARTPAESEAVLAGFFGRPPGRVNWRWPPASRSARCTRRSRSTRASSSPRSRAARACSGASPRWPRRRRSSSARRSSRMGAAAAKMATDYKAGVDEIRDRHGRHRQGARRPGRHVRPRREARARRPPDRRQGRRRPQHPDRRDRRHPRGARGQPARLQPDHEDRRQRQRPRRDPAVRRLERSRPRTRRARSTRCSGPASRPGSACRPSWRRSSTSARRCACSASRFDESIALLSKWEKEGVNTETALAGLKYGVKTLAKDGVAAADMGAELKARIEAIGKSADPVGESIKTFGLRAGPDLAAAILEGRFATDDLVATIVNGSDTIAAATADTKRLRRPVGPGREHRRRSRSASGSCRS